MSSKGYVVRGVRGSVKRRMKMLEGELNGVVVGVVKRRKKV